MAWIAQAVVAYRAARTVSGRYSGAAWLLAVAPVVIALLTGFWLFAGAQASPAATFERYIGAWRHNDPAAAVGLFAQPIDPLTLVARWEAQEKLIAARVETIAEADPEFSLNRQDPDTNLRFELHVPEAGDATSAGGPVEFDVHVVRQVTVPSTFFGLVPASRTETRIVETVGDATLVRRPLEGPLAGTGAFLWVIQSINFNGEP